MMAHLEEVDVGKVSRGQDLVKLVLLRITRKQRRESRLASSVRDRKLDGLAILVPIDLIVLDWQSWPQGQWGWKTFDRTRFPDPDAFTAALHDKNVKLMISIWPSMQGDENEDRREMLENGYMLGNRVFYDAFNPAARALYWRQAN